MQALLKKEYLVNKQSLIIGIIMMTIFSLATGVFGNLLSLGVIFSCFQPSSNETNESSENNEMFTNSLPVTREKIVFSKYLFSLIIGAIYLSIVFLMTTFIPIFEAITTKELMVGLAVVSMYLSVYFPLKYLIGKSFFVISFFANYIILAALAYSIFNQGESFDYWGMYNSYTAFTTLQVVSLSLLISSAVLYVSFKYASKVYKKKDF